MTAKTSQPIPPATMSATRIPFQSLSAVGARATLDASVPVIDVRHGDRVVGHEVGQDRANRCRDSLRRRIVDGITLTGLKG